MHRIWSKSQAITTLLVCIFDLALRATIQILDEEIVDQGSGAQIFGCVELNLCPSFVELFYTYNLLVSIYQMIVIFA